MITTDKVKEIFASINDQIEAADLDDNKNLTDQGLESLDTFDFFLQIEDDFGVKVSDDQMDKLNTIQKIVDYVNENI
ncbi:acyl carrier protein [Gelidibacter japonicus]|uniref:acyl carrier protein n=1 Tax=Gelidibacter japonicus TaxID=1962232 RepID=UPI003A93601A